DSLVSLIRQFQFLVREFQPFSGGICPRSKFPYFSIIIRTFPSPADAEADQKWWNDPRRFCNDLLPKLRSAYLIHSSHPQYPASIIHVCPVLGMGRGISHKICAALSASERDKILGVGGGLFRPNDHRTGNARDQTNNASGHQTNIKQTTLLM